MGRRDHVLMVTMGAIIILNIIAIIVLNNRLADREEALAAQRIAQQPAPVVREEVREVPVVRTVVMQPQCADCFNISEYTDELSDTVFMAIEQGDADAIRTFAPARLPAIAFNASLLLYPSLTDGWEGAGSIVSLADGPYAGTWYVLPTHNAPYLENGSVRGLVSVTYLMKPSCTECYNSSVLDNLMLDARIHVARKNIVDADSLQGRSIIRRYNISAVPTVIMDAEASYYENIQPAWSIVGSFEDDGSYVLRSLDRLEVTYYDLSTDRVMVP